MGELVPQKKTDISIVIPRSVGEGEGKILLSQVLNEEVSPTWTN